MREDAAPPSATRRAMLAAWVAEVAFLPVADAALRFGVTEVTVRADLAALESAGALRRVRGGAIALRERETPVEATARRDAEVKDAIGRRAAAAVRPGTAIILDVGSTTLAVAHALVSRHDLADVVVVTNGLGIALALEPAIPRLTVVLTGGTLRPLQHSLVNPMASRALQDLHVDLAILGCNGIEESGRVSNLNLPEAEVKQAMLTASTRRLLVADAGKFRQSHLGTIGSLTDFAMLVTGGPGADELASSAEAFGCEPVLVEASR
ncbi:MAG TPA: DeoR/GlpR family DNA-binding transcription regulator [Naasia sp.]|jgi:DeoR family transcriptional regulator of aga operon